MSLIDYCGKISLVVFVFVAIGFGVWEASILPPDPVKVKPSVYDAQGAKYFDLGNRTIEYFDFGAEKGTPLLVIPGERNTGKFFKVYDDWAKKNGIRLLTISLPGYGLTDNEEGRQFEDYRDATELVSKLKLDKFYVAGAHLGAIHAALTATQNPQKVLGVGLFAPAVHLTKLETVTDLSWLEHTYVHYSTVSNFADVFAFVSAYTFWSDYPSAESYLEHNPTELAILNKTPQMKESLIWDTVRAFNRTHRGYAEFARLANTFAVNWKNISSKKTLISIGKKDYAAQFQEEYVKLIPNSQLVTYEDQGRYHPYTHFEDLVAKLLDKKVGSAQAASPAASKPAVETKTTKTEL
jgi:pimeloyl-ACP methyl ester carboxylesterase